MKQKEKNVYDKNMDIKNPGSNRNRLQNSEYGFHCIVNLDFSKNLQGKTQK
ncbi:hypothetical protein LEP1GSC062_3936 [Leptospira alexanderi serovar Manhao 3 str. L 60]|uniref:Uncharacterized protein n=1 Tax=Leptospira alexanderi serovar Manhao 3 str. L 60 TaxID=1049759 RepID=V6I2M4_9LEPT|nr:hypothetical protein LEP1GSC062_3936 [Leptospira alexanderi serovar Manhao 3 str. L 60]